MPATVSAQLTVDLCSTMDRLRHARVLGESTEELVLERRLNWLIEKLPRKDAR